MQKSFTFAQLKDSAQEWALQQVIDKHPVESRDTDLSSLSLLYDYNRFGDIIDYASSVESEQEGQDPEYYEDRLGDSYEERLGG